jgi:hypothetical protein
VQWQAGLNLRILKGFENHSPVIFLNLRNQPQKRKPPYMKLVVTQKIQDSSKKSKTYNRYEKLIADIEQKQQFKQNLQDGLQKAAAKLNAELSPLMEERQLILRSYIMRLDELANDIVLSKQNSQWFESYMRDELQMLLDFFGHQDEVLSKLFKKYTDLPVSDIAEDEDLQNLIRSMSDAFGFEVDAKELLEKGEKEYMDTHRDEILDHMRQNQNFSDTDEDEPKTTKQKAKGPASNQDVQLAKDARSIYMRLVKKFHPDLETDPTIINQKNEIIKLVTKAYQENDFFALLKLQITHIDDNEKDAELITDDMIKRFNKILQRQLNEIDKWIREMHFASGAMIGDFIDKNGKFSPQKFSTRRNRIVKENKELKAIVDDSKRRPKGWFKEQMEMIKDSALDEMMADMFDF